MARFGSWVLALIAITAACSSSDDEPAEVASPSDSPPDEALDRVLDDSTATGDVRRDFPEPPEGGIQFLTPDYVVPPGEERQFCYFDTYRGERVGMVSQTQMQSPHGHHVIMLQTSITADEVPDQTSIECSDPESLEMAATTVLFLVVEEVVDNTAHYSLPPGMAKALEPGTRVVIQSHYINTTGEELIVRDAINVGLMPVEDVETWASPFIMTDVQFEIPAGSSAISQFDCTPPAGTHLLNLTGHMHEWGSSISVDITRPSGTERLYDVPSWTPTFRDDSPKVDYGAEGLLFQGDEALTLRCEWENDLDTPILFPQEMCAAFGMFYPAEADHLCLPGQP